MDKSNLIVALVIGLVAGWLASWIVGGGGLVQYLVSGVLGSFVGSWVLNKTSISLGIQNELVRDTVTAMIGAVIIMLVAHVLT
jgi:uncharacterized membrane protein YeaQ/YmgE (transglycosylase-associated protein family)